LKQADIVIVIWFNNEQTLWLTKRSQFLA